MGSVVLDDIASFSIATGNPAKVKSIRRDIENYNKLDEVTASYIINKLKRST
jgi:acetyltransferase-like isoleucine patch superfamily enzyme